MSEGVATPPLCSVPALHQAANEDLFQEAGEDWWVFGELMAEDGVVFEGHQVLEWGDGETFGIHYKTDRKTRPISAATAESISLTI